MANETERQIAHDLALCELGMVLTKGSLWQRYVRQRKICMDAIAEINRRDGLDGMSDEELLAALRD
jgi:hypothetical protein